MGPNTVNTVDTVENNNLIEVQEETTPSVIPEGEVQESLTQQLESGINKQFVTTRSFQINAFLSLVKVILEQDFDIRQKYDYDLTGQEAEAIFDTENEDYEEINAYMIEEKLKLYNHFLEKGYGKNMIMSIRKKLPIIQNYYAFFNNSYHDFAFNKGEHIPVLFAATALRYLTHTNKIKVSDEVFNTSKIFGSLKYASIIPKEEQQEYLTLVEEMFRGIKKITTQNLKSKNKKRKKNRRK